MLKVNLFQRMATVIILIAVIYACFVILGFEALMSVVRWAYTHIAVSVV
jgi:hypothetical protein